MASERSVAVLFSHEPGPPCPEQTKQSSGRIQHIWPQIKSALLYICAGLALGLFSLTLASAWYNTRELQRMLKQTIHEFKATRVPQYEAPGIFFLQNGLYTYECITSKFRLDPKPRDEEFSGFVENATNIRRSRISDSCMERNYQFSITLQDQNDFSEQISTMPDWLKANIITTMTDVSECAGDGTWEYEPSRARRDAFDDRIRCDGRCGQLWQCANDPSICQRDNSFHECFTGATHLMTSSDTCRQYYSCLAGEVRLPESCGQHIWCLDTDNIDSVECSHIWDCMTNGTKEGLCRSVFQCMEDQIELKCELHTTAQPNYLVGSQFEDTCAAINEMVNKQHPSIRNQNNPKLNLVLVRGPSEYKDRNFMFTSLRLAGQSRGVHFAVHPSYTEAALLWQSVDKYSLLAQLFTDLRWNMLTRGFRTYCFLSKTVVKVEGATQDIRMRLEMSLSSLNFSDPIQSDYRPAELYLQWKDGYIIEGNTFIGVSVWDAVTFVAATILMLERSWSVAGRVMNGLVDDRCRRLMSAYGEGSPQWAIFHGMLSRRENLLESYWQLGRVKAEEKRQAKLDRNRRMEQQRRRQREEKMRKKLERAKALKTGTVSKEVLEWEEKRRVEWKIYKQMLRRDNEKNRQFMQRMSEREREEYVLEQEKRKRAIEKYEQRLEERMKKKRTEDGDDSQSEVSDGGGGQQPDCVVETDHRLPWLSKPKNKITTKNNAAFSMPWADEDGRISTTPTRDNTSPNDAECSSQHNSTQHKLDV